MKKYALGMLICGSHIWSAALPVGAAGKLPLAMAGGSERNMKPLQGSWINYVRRCDGKTVKELVNDMDGLYRLDKDGNCLLVAVVQHEESESLLTWALEAYSGSPEFPLQWRDAGGASVIKFAQSEDALRRLQGFGFDINQQDSKGQTALHGFMNWDESKNPFSDVWGLYANEKMKLARAFLAQGADLGVSDNEDNTPVHKLVSTVQLREEIFSKYYDYQSVGGGFSGAVRTRDVAQFFEYIINHPTFNPVLRNHAGYTVLDIAKCRKIKHLIKLLVAREGSTELAVFDGGPAAGDAREIDRLLGDHDKEE